jgi:hypothetical protein
LRAVMMTNNLQPTAYYLQLPFSAADDDMRPD